MICVREGTLETIKKGSHFPYSNRKVQKTKVYWDWDYSIILTDQLCIEMWLCCEYGRNLRILSFDSRNVSLVKHFYWKVAPRVDHFFKWFTMVKLEKTFVKPL